MSKARDRDGQATPGRTPQGLGQCARPEALGGTWRRVAAGALAVLIGTAAFAAGAALEYPAAARGDHVDVYHGVQVPDPYRWMEDIDSPQTRAWVQAEAHLTQSYLERIPGRREIAQRLEHLWNFVRWSPPDHHGAWWFYAHNDGLQNQPVLFVTPDPATPAHVLLDPNALSSDGTIALRESAISDDGKYFAYALSDAGSDWQIWHVRDVASGRDLPDELHWSKAGGGSWRKDDSGFYYTRYAQPKSAEALKAANEYEKLYFHRLGTPQAQDRLIYTRSDDPDWFVSGEVTDDGHYLVIEANHGDEVQNTFLVQDLMAHDAPVRPIIAKPSAVYDVIGNIAHTFYVRTDDGAPRYRIIAIDLERPQPAHWRTIVPEGADTLDGATLVGHQLIAQYLHDAHSAVQRYGVDGQRLGEVRLEGLGTAGGFTGRVQDSTTYYSFSSFTQPASIYRLDLATGASTLWRQPEVAGFKPADFEAREVFYSSKDGTRVPLYIVARRGVRLDGNNPTILYGYGGFDVSLEPGFSPAIAGWLQLGGVYAQANLRGGGEYGRAWHEAGMKTHKQNVFDDFAAAAQYLIAQHWTRAQRLAIRGASNGGLLVGATEEQHPELFAACIAQVGVMDMLRFRDFTVGKGWESDYGSVDNPAEFRAMLAYSPLQNVKAGVDYPPTLITTGDHDDRVFPAHSFKFAAAMQHADPHGNPILLRIETRAGHGQGKPTSKQIAETADIYAFVLNAMGLAHAEVAGGARH
ncbi:MAG TPA: prolyl oligopeptidase family serine peptidase [Steroidobacteraceae bacterium]|nr:prolyl oligopeptidase family serine peptidase [Steroidobacteraceae bacterium]